MKLVILFLIFMVNTGVFIRRKQRTLQVLRIRSCPEYPDLPAAVTKFSKRNLANGSYALNLTFTVQRKLPVDPEASFSLLKCDLAGTPDSCEYYVKDFKVKKFCEKIDLKNQLWSTVVDKIKPPLHCPIEPVSTMLTSNGSDDETLENTLLEKVDNIAKEVVPRFNDMQFERHFRINVTDFEDLLNNLTNGIK